MTTQPFPPPPQGKRARSVTEVYILMEDADATTFSSVSPTGEFVLSEAEAKAWVEAGKGKGWGNYDARREYRKIKLRN